MKPETVLSTDGREVTLIHLMIDGRIVCMPNLQPKDMSSSKTREAPHMRTDSPEGVTCPMCKRVKNEAKGKAAG